MAPKKTTVKSGPAGVAKRNVPSETQSRSASNSSTKSAASSVATPTLTTPAGVKKPSRNDTGTADHATKMVQWHKARASQRQAEKRALEAQIGQLERWIADDVDKAAGWQMTADELAKKEAGSSVEGPFAAALEKKKAEEAKPSDEKTELESKEGF
ncbi:hypothetical protein FOQG_11473 [Fusarium oxysporum f. sp. raphani 54005]|uniref:Uncharacterized protein n=1 Tax=Fusarium oxysporum f. sp. raphani 54005 TaxID=1089458 RepID=X0CPG6_FUSOX|nr:hypothetical protein FOQG_11473 [Fusarium oxysporum f. sp. raphani 54005]